MIIHKINVNLNVVNGYSLFITKLTSQVASDLIREAKHYFGFKL